MGKSLHDSHLICIFALIGFIFRTAERMFATAEYKSEECPKQIPTGYEAQYKQKNNKQ